MRVLPSVYPATNNQRDNWILERRPSRQSLNPFLPYAFSLEDECSADGIVVSVATVFLTNRECPWRCLMCDLWQNTLLETVPRGAIPAQINHALAHLGAARQIKLYNSGSFFDPHAVPVEDYAAIASRLDSFERVIVESHPALLGNSCLRLRDLLKGRLEVAMGLETAHPDILSKLNKRMTLEQFSQAAAWLKQNDIDLRAFILVKPPFMPQLEALYWAERSLEFAFHHRAGVAVLIPTRGGNGAMDELASQGEFSPPGMDIVEAAFNYGISLNQGRVFTDLWDLERISNCPACYLPRRDRLNRMNLRQRLEPIIECPSCGVPA